MNDKPPSRLAQTLAGAATQAAPASSVSAPPLRTIAAGKRGEDVTLPVLGRVRIQLPGARRWQEIEADCRRELARLEVPSDGIQAATMWEAELAMRVLAEAVRDPDDHAVAFGTLEDWGGLDNDLISMAWHAFGDVRERLDPVSLPLTSDEMFAIAGAVKKKDPVLLRSYGVARLSLWLASMEFPPSTSPLPSSPSSD